MVVCLCVSLAIDWQPVQGVLMTAGIGSTLIRGRGWMDVFNADVRKKALLTV